MSEEKYKLVESSTSMESIHLNGLDITFRDDAENELTLVELVGGKAELTSSDLYSLAQAISVKAWQMNQGIIKKRG